MRARLLLLGKTAAAAALRISQGGQEPPFIGMESESGFRTPTRLCRYPPHPSPLTRLPAPTPTPLPLAARKNRALKARRLEKDKQSSWAVVSETCATLLPTNASHKMSVSLNSGWGSIYELSRKPSCLYVPVQDARLRLSSAVCGDRRCTCAGGVASPGFSAHPVDALVCRAPGPGR